MVGTYKIMIEKKITMDILFEQQTIAWQNQNYTQLHRILKIIEFRRKQQIKKKKKLWKKK